MGSIMPYSGNKIDIRSLNIEELKEYMESLGEKGFRASQLFSWMHGKLSGSIDEMTNLPLSLRERLKAETEYVSLKQVDLRVSSDGTRKYLFSLWDGNLIESVWMKYREWRSVCVSSQVGCNMGCRFCASGIGGKVRDLSPSEMLDQVYSIQKETGERVSNIVVMGSGEPLENYDNLLRFISLVSDEKGLNIGERHITVSTCGLVPEIRRLAGEKLQINLALSLHAPNDEKRKAIMPIANRYSIAELKDALKFYFRETGRRITIEYALSKSVNDSDEDAEELSKVLKGLNCHVNLIPVNPVKERDFISVSREETEGFKSKLEKNGINVTIRREMGRDIEGACGQLRRRHLEAIDV